MSDRRHSSSRINKRDTRKKKKRKRIYLYAVLPLSIIFLLIISYSIYLYVKAQDTVERSYEDIDRENKRSELRKETVDPIDDHVSVLIIGVDESEQRAYGEGSRSDTLMLATFNKDLEDVKLLTIPRDSYVYVPEVDYFTKITHAHYYGGPKATIDTIENFLNVPVDYYVRLDFEAFIEVIDALGGLMYDVPFEISEMDSKDKKDAIHLMPGYQKLNGEEALALARTRKYDSDIERGKRQQQIIKEIVKQTASASSILKIDDLMEAVGNNMTTNLTFKQMKSFMSYGLKRNIALEALNLEGIGGKLSDGYWYYQVDEESRTELENELREHLDLPIISDNTDDTENPLVEESTISTSYP